MLRPSTSLSVQIHIQIFSDTFAKVASLEAPIWVEQRDVELRRMATAAAILSQFRMMVMCYS